MKKSLKEIIKRHQYPDGRWEEGYDLERCKRIDAGKEKEEMAKYTMNVIQNHAQFLDDAELNKIVLSYGIPKNILFEWEDRIFKKARSIEAAEATRKLDDAYDVIQARTMIIVLDAIRIMMEKNGITSCGWKRMTRGLFEDGYINMAVENAEQMGFVNYFNSFRGKAGKDKNGEYLEFGFDSPEANEAFNITMDIERSTPEYYDLPPKKINELAFLDGAEMTNIQCTVAIIQACADLKDYFSKAIDEFFRLPQTKKNREEFRKKMNILADGFDFPKKINEKLKSINIGNGNLTKLVDALEKQKVFKLPDASRSTLDAYWW